MALTLKFMDGFNHGTSGAIHGTKYLSGGIPGGFVTGRAAGFKAANMVNTTQLTRDLGITAGKICYFQFAWSLPVGASIPNMLGAMFGVNEATSTWHVQIQGDGLGHLAAYRGAGSTLLGTSTLTVVADRWYVIQGAIKIHDTTGYVKVKVDGVDYLNLTGIDTRNGGTGNWSQTAIAGTQFGSAPSYIADYFVWEGDDGDAFPSRNLRIYTGLPSTDAVAAGSNTDFTLSTGTDQGALVDDATGDGDTSYVQSNTPGHRVSVKYPTWISGVGTVHALQLTPYLKQTDAGARTAKTMVRIGGVNYDHPSDLGTIPTGYEYRQQIWEQNPATAAAWTVSELNNVAYERGLKIET